MMFREDAFFDTLSMVGAKIRKIFTAAGVSYSDDELEGAYLSAMGRKIVEKLPTEATRPRWWVSIPDNGDEKEVEKLDKINREIAKKWADLGARDAILQAWIWGRLKGWGAVLPLYEGSNENSLQMPAKERPGEIKNLLVFERREVSEIFWNRDPNQPGRFGQPELYRITPENTVGSRSFLIHHTNLWIFGGARTTRRRKNLNMGFDDSILVPLMESLRGFEATWESFQDSVGSSMVLRLKNLTSLVAGGQRAKVEEKISMIERLHARSRMIALDMDDDISTHEMALSGHAQAVDKLIAKISADVDIPATVLFGISPGGLNATGESDLKIWQNTVNAAREDKLRPCLEKFVASVAPGLQDWEIEFGPMFDPTAQEIAQERAAYATADVGYINAGVYAPEEVALARSSARGWQRDIVIDLDLRRRALADLEAKMSEEEDNADETQQDFEGQGEEGQAPETDSAESDDNGANRTAGGDDGAPGQQGNAGRGPQDIEPDETT